MIHFPFMFVHALFTLSHINFPLLNLSLSLSLSLSLLCPTLIPLYFKFSLFASHISYFCDQCHNVVETPSSLCLQLQATTIVWKVIRKKNQDMDFGYGFSFRRLFLRALLFLGIIWFMFIAISTMNHQTKSTILVQMNVNVISKQLKFVGMQRHTIPSDSRLIFVSKRRVPNGPDPIHNRRAVKYRQPPNEA